MSDLLIKGVETPKSCYVCPFCDYVSARCDAVKGNPYTPESRYEKRADFCPLVPVPSHGRLIDADALVDSFDPSDFWNPDAEDNCFAAIHVVNCAPTIIPAEEGGT